MCVALVLFHQCEMPCAVLQGNIKEANVQFTSDELCVICMFDLSIFGYIFFN